jgi:hypothetical protein
MAEPKKETKYVVFKIDDLREYFKSNLGGDQIGKIQQGIEKMRIRKGKNPYNKYIICNQDEPYAEQVWQTILEGEKKKDHYQVQE